MQNGKLFLTIDSKAMVALFFFPCNIRKEDIKYLNIPDQFTNEIFELWAKVHFTGKDNQNSVKEQILWNNSYIRIENKPVFIITEL